MSYGASARPVRIDARNGRIDDISELFGDRTQGGYAELAGYGINGDGKISAADAIWSSLKVWRDRNRDGVTDAGELVSLSSLGIVSLSLANRALDVTTPQGAQLLSVGDVTLVGGGVRRMFEAIFTANEVDTRYNGEGGRAAWQGDIALDQKGFGSITGLGVAMANDVGLGELAAERSAAMGSFAGAAPTMKELLAQAGAPYRRDQRKTDVFLSVQTQTSPI